MFDASRNEEFQRQARNSKAERTWLALVSMFSDFTKPQPPNEPHSKQATWCSACSSRLPRATATCRWSTTSGQRRCCELCAIALFVPLTPAPIPIVLLLLFFFPRNSGLTCTDDNVCQKAATAFRAAAARGVMVVAPDTSPRGDGVATGDSWDFGLGASFYVDATVPP